MIRYADSRKEINTTGITFHDRIIRVAADAAKLTGRVVEVMTESPYGVKIAPRVGRNGMTLDTQYVAHNSSGKIAAGTRVKVYIGKDTYGAATVEGFWVGGTDRQETRLSVQVLFDPHPFLGDVLSRTLWINDLVLI